MKILVSIRSVIVFLLVLIVFSCTEKQVSNSIPGSTPEAEGISSKAILTFIDSADVSKTTEFHSFMIIRHDKVVAEGWWRPMGPEIKHTLYSTSKSFTSTAVGLAINEGKLSLDDPVISFFPESLPDSVSPYLKELKIKHLLTMSIGQRRESPTTGNDWVKDFLATKVDYEPGTVYRYNSMASFMLSAIVQKVTGEKVIDYLTPKLFEPLGIKDYDWETSPKGINTGGWGLRLKTEDLAKFGLLYLHKGKWNGKQILPEKWVEEATSVKIYQNPKLTPSERDSVNDSMQGYCYQFWRAKHNSYMANGAFGQFILIMPDKDAIVVLTAESKDMWGELDMVWKYLYPGIKDKALPEDNEALAELKDKIASLALPVPPKVNNKEMRAKIAGKTISFPENQRQIRSMTLQFSDNDICTLNLKTDTASYDISFGSGSWQQGETTLHGPNLFTRSTNNLNGLPPFKIAGAYTWNDDQSLELTLRYLNMHTRRFIFRFGAGNKVMVDISDSNSSRFRPPALEGVISE